MSTEIQMPQLGLTMKEGLVMEWKKKVGESVKRGEVLFNVENDKATIDVEAQADGVLSEIRVKEMVTVPVGTILGLISSAAGTPATQQISEPQEFPDPHGAPEPEPVIEAKPATTPPPSSTPRPVAVPRSDGFVLASPLARATAKTLGLDLAKTKGTGPQGAVLARDLPAQAMVAPLVVPTIGLSFEDRPLTRIQKMAADRMTESWTSIPQFTLYGEADADAVLRLLQHYKKLGEPVSLTVITAKLFAHALAKHPLLNATWLGNGSVRTFREININIAVDTPEGLTVPVLRDCLGRGFTALGKDMKDISNRAKTRALMPEDYEGGTVTLSNLGMFGVTRFRAIVNPPQTAILAVGAVSERVCSSPQGGFIARSFMEFSITADHRAVDGACAARFLATFKALLENPVLALE